MEKTVQEQKQLLTEVIQKLMVILGAELTLSKVRNVHGLTVAEDGTVTDMQTEPTVLLQEIIGEFVGLSGEIVKQITDLLATKQMEQKPHVDLPSAPVQPGQEQPQTMVMPTLQAAPVASAGESTAVMDTATPASEPVAAASEPAPAPETAQPAMPAQPQLSQDPFPNTQPAATEQPVATEQQQAQPEPAAPTEPTAEAAPTAEATPAPAPEPAPAAQPAAQAPAAPVQAQPNQNDPDMQHIINEALKQTK